MNPILIIIITIISLIIFYTIYNYLKKHSPTSKISREKPISSHRPKEGVDVDIMRIGNGKEAISGRGVRVHYSAFLESGEKVDSSYDKGEEFSFTLGRRQVIPGWEAGMLGMKEGEKRRFTISPENAYGDKGKANVPPNAVIIFEVELIKVF